MREPVVKTPAVVGMSRKVSARRARVALATSVGLPERYCGLTTVWSWAETVCESPWRKLRPAQMAAALERQKMIRHVARGLQASS